MTSIDVPMDQRAAAPATKTAVAAEPPDITWLSLAFDDVLES